MTGTRRGLYYDYGDGTGASAVVTVDESGTYVAGGGGGGGASTIADGADVATGAKADAAVGDATATVNSHLRFIAKSLGEVQASPTSNTVLDRLKALLTGTILAAGSAIIGKVGIDQTTPGTTNGVVNNAGENVIGKIGGSQVLVQTSKTRPSDGNVYAPNDAIAESTSVGTNWTFTNVARVTGGTGTIVGARLETDQVANVSAYRLYLYNAAPTAINDNAECTYLIANKASYLGYIDFPVLAKDSANTTAAKAELGGGLLNFVCAADRNLYGQLRTTTGFTPASGQIVTVSLISAQD